MTDDKPTYLYTHDYFIEKVAHVAVFFLCLGFFVGVVLGAVAVAVWVLTVK